MRAAERAGWAVATTALVVALFAMRDVPVPSVVEPVEAASAPARAALGSRLTMAALHQQGGVPLGWQLTLPPGNVDAGRARFDALGCPACHAVAGEHFASAVAAPAGPELTGMGSHHPPAYFAESILDPDAVRIDEPGYLEPDGRSRMPTYDTMTLGELRDVVAYLASLHTDAPPSCHAPGMPAVAMTRVSTQDRPAPRTADARAFFAQSYDVLPGKLAALEAWFARDGRAAFGEAQGLVGIATYADVAKPAGALTTVFAFRDEAALRTFVADPAMAEAWKTFDALVGPHGHVASDRPLVYPVATLSFDPPR